MYIQRHIERKFLKTASIFKVVLITGARQVGKSTFLKHLAQKENKGRNYITLDNPDALKIAKEDPELFFQVYPLPIIIDEIQYAPELFSYIKYLVDQTDETGSIWLTGSQSYAMMKNVQETLAGRIGVLHMYSMTSSEVFSENSNDQGDWSFDTLSSMDRPVLSLPKVFERIFQGGMPQAIDYADEQRAIYYDSYIQTYLMRDVMEIGKVTKTSEFRIFLGALAAITSQQVNYANLSQIVGVSQNTIKDWIKLLESLGIIYLLKPYANNELKRLVKTPKIYFTDTGICAYLSKWLSQETLQNGAANGAYFENYVVMEIIKNKSYGQTSNNFMYYRDASKREIDLIIEENQERYCFEIKLSAAPKRESIKHFQLIENDGGGIICMKSNVMPIDQKYNFIPCSLL